jgi:ornithine carbamoyltransferase
MMQKKIISLNELSTDEVLSLIELAVDLKNNRTQYHSCLAGKNLLLLFQKTSTRTRVAFELGMKQLGGDAVVMDWRSSNFTISPISHEARYLQTAFDCIMARIKRHGDLMELADAVHIPVINGCCNLYHPSQALADLMTVFEIKGSYDTSICYVGVQNNVANSLLFACSKLGTHLIFVTPLQDEIPADVAQCMEETEAFEVTLDLTCALKQCEFLYTDTWINMELFNDAGYRKEKERRIGLMSPYQVNRKLLKGSTVYIMHDMPVHPGFEIDEYAINCEQSVIFRQAENRLYTAQALLIALMEARLP